MGWIIVLEICGVIGGIATAMALLLAPMFWLGSKIDAFRQEMHQEMKDFKDAIHLETKDFHGRLISLETRKNMEDRK